MRVRVFRSEYCRTFELPDYSQNGHIHNDIVQRSPLYQSCWEGPFSAHLGLFHRHVIRQNDSSYTGGYAYSTSWAEVKSQADAGCLWCRLLYATWSKDEFTPSRSPVEIIVGSQPNKSALRKLKNRWYVPMAYSDSQDTCIPTPVCSACVLIRSRPC